MNSPASFTDTFLRDSNQNGLAHILSFLSAGELGRAACTSKHLAHFINKEDEDHVNIVWQGAERGMTKIHDTYSGERLKSFVNARDHCQRFGIASKYAKRCEEADDLPEDQRMGLAQVLTDLFHIKGCDKNSVAAMVEQGEMDQTSEEELLSRFTIGPARSMSEITEEEKEKMSQQSQRTRDELDTALKEPVPDKEYIHDVFVRMKSIADDVVFEGFCSLKQTLVWNIALDSPVTRFGRHEHELVIPMMQRSLSDTKVMQSFVKSQSPFEQTLELQFTVVTINKRDLRVQFLFHGDQTTWKPTCSYPKGPCRTYEGYLKEKNPRGSIQLGPSGMNRYALQFSAGILTCETENGTEALAPDFLLKIRKDQSIFHQAMFRSIQSQFQNEDNLGEDNESDDEENDME